MQQLTNITSEPKQKMNFRLDNGDFITLSLEFVPSQLGWYFSVVWNDFESTCHRITNCPNILRQYKKYLPFGIGCVVQDDSEPYFVDDFRNGRASLFVLNESDIQYVEDTFYERD